MPVAGDTHCLSASQASHRVPAADRRQADVYYNRYYTLRNDVGPLIQEKAYAVRQFFVAGGGFEPPTSGL